MESESKEQDQDNDVTLMASYGYVPPEDYKKFIDGEWSIEERIQLAVEIAGLREDVRLLEFCLSFDKEHGRAPTEEELNDAQFEMSIISHPSAHDLYQGKVTEEKVLETLRKILEEKEKRLGQILVDAAAEMDASSFKELVKKIQQYKEQPLFKYAHPQVGGTLMALRSYKEENGKLPNQEELFERLGIALSDKQKRRIKELLGLAGVLPRKKRTLRGEL